MSAAWPQFLMDASIVGLIRGYACRNRGSNFYVLLISSLLHNNRETRKAGKRNYTGCIAVERGRKGFA